MQPASRFEPQTMLRTLVEHQVEFIVVGGVSAALHGAVLTTLDLDIVYNVTSDNVQRLLDALLTLNAIYRDPAGRRIAPKVSHLAAGGHNLLDTDRGYLDVLGYVGTPETPRRYADLLATATPLAIAGTTTVLVLDLATLIVLKEEANRDKDRLALPLLREYLATIQATKGAGGPQG